MSGYAPPDTPAAPALRQLVNEDDMVEAAIKLSGVPRPRISATLQPGLLTVIVRSPKEQGCCSDRPSGGCCSEGSSGGGGCCSEGSQIEFTEKVLHMPIMGASWNSEMRGAAAELVGSPIVFDNGNEYGKEVFDEESTVERVVLVKRGQCALCDKAVRSGVAGAAAVLVHDDKPEQAPGIMGAASMAPDFPPIPGFMVPLEGAEELRELLMAGGEARILALDGGHANLFCRLGEQPFRELTARFYSRVLQDSEAWFRALFEGRDQDEAAENLADFLVQRMGGLPLFNAKKGPSALIGRHLTYDLTEAHAVRWLEHMEAAIDEVPAIDSDSAAVLMDYFRYTAHFISHSVKVAHSDSTTGADPADSAVVGGG